MIGKEKLRIIALPILLLLLTSVSVMSARTWEPGVYGGDYFVYEMYGIYTSNRSNTTISIPEFEKNNTDWTRINITSISGSEVYQIYTLHFKNNSEFSFRFETDLDPLNQGVFRMSEKGVPICAANLSSGDSIPTADLTINQTMIRVCADGSRETNHASWSGPDEWGDVYFDKETGMLVGLERTHRFINTVTGSIVEKTDVIRLTDTNRWQVKS